MGHVGKGDYSVWHYNITPEYASLKLGQNKITAKISCIVSPSNVTKFNSVNVTGTWCTLSQAKRMWENFPSSDRFIAMQYYMQYQYGEYYI